MKTDCIAINSNLIEIEKQSKIIKFINKKLYEIGERVSLISYTDNNYDKLKNVIQEQYDVIFILGTDSSIFNHNIKNNLCRLIGDSLDNLDTSYSALKKYCDNNNIVFSMQEEMEVKLPSKCIPLCDSEYYNNGFMHKLGNTYIIYLPENYGFMEQNYYNYIMPLLRDLVGVKNDYVVLKCFGILEKDIKAILNEFYSNSKISIQIVNDGLDNSIYIRYDSNIIGSEIQEIISNICQRLNKFIYSTEDESIYQTASHLINLQKKRIAVAETITLGNICRQMTLIADNNISSGFLLTNTNNLFETFNIDKKIIDTYGEYSVNSVYELDNMLLEKSCCDVAVFVLGHQGSDVCYIAIGDIDGIHVYKNKIAKFDDSLIENISKTAIFYLIKKLHKNDLQFN